MKLCRPQELVFYSARVGWGGGAWGVPFTALEALSDICALVYLITHRNGHVNGQKITLHFHAGLLPECLQYLMQNEVMVPHKHRQKRLLGRSALSRARNTLVGQS